MSPEQEGAYIRLLCYCWDSGDCSLPNNTDQLIAMSRISKGGWEMVGKCFIPHPEKQGFLTNQRLYQELLKQRAWQQKSSIGGKNSAIKRIEKQKLSKGGTQMVGEWLVPKGNIATASASSKREESSVSAFEVFFKKFPPQRKGNKEKTESAWNAALTRSTEEEILNGLEAYINSPEVRIGRAKGAAAWLNDDRWSCDYSERPNPKPEKKPYHQTLENYKVS